MHSFLIGVGSSVLAAAIIYIFRYQLAYIINFLFFKVYPNLSGEYKVYSYEWDSSGENEIETLEIEENQENYGVDLPTTRSTNDDLLAYLKATDAEPFMTASIKQFAYKLEGEVRSIQRGEIVDIEKFKGRVTPSRVVILNSETITPGHHNFGTYLLTLTPTTKIIKGARNYLCINCGDVGSSYILLEKIK